MNNANAVVLGISPDQPAALRSWRGKRRLEFTLLSDPECSVLGPWGVWKKRMLIPARLKALGMTRSHWVIDEEGRVIDAQIGVSPQKSVQRALAVLGGS